MDGFYINLEKRIDRKKKIENLQNSYPFFKNIKHFKAIYDADGRIGCYKSHIKCLELCLHQEGDFFLIIEDDFSISNVSFYKQFLVDFPFLQMKENWDIFLFTNSLRKFKKKPFFYNFYQTLNAQTTTGYIIRKTFIPIFLKHLKIGLNLYSKTRKKYFSIDYYWKILQKRYFFVYYHKKFIIQYPNFSDIEKKNVNYFK